MGHVDGDDDGVGYGVHGKSQSGFGVFGESVDSEGVHAHSTNGFGVNATSDSNDGIVGTWGGSGDGVVGVSTADGSGVSGTSVNGNGVSGVCDNGIGGNFFGGSAPILLRTPPEEVDITGPPTTGNHFMGELFVDSHGGLYFCTQGDGTARLTPFVYSKVVGK